MIISQNPARRSKVLISAFLLSALAGRPSVARAEEDPSAGETAAARALAVDGLKLAKAGQCREAVEKLERAEKLRHSAIVLARLGECYVSIGKLVQGTEALRKFLREPLPADANPSLTQAYEHAQTLVQETKGNIAGLTIALNGGDKSKVTLTVDGTEVPSTLVGVELPVDPGEHVIEVSGAAYLKSSARAKLAPGEKQSISIELKPDPDAAAKQKAEEPARAGAVNTLPAPTEGRAPTHEVDLSTQPAPQSSGNSRALAYVSYGVGALGIGAGILFGRSAMQDKDQLDGQCPGKVCPPDQEDRLNSAKTKGLVSTIGFGVGAAGIVLGTVMLVTSSGSSSSSAQQSAPATAFRLRPRAAVGLNQIQVGADF